MKRIILVFIILCFNSIYCQENNFSILFNTGRASDNDAYGSFAGGGGLHVWNAGPIFRLGAEYELNNSFSAVSHISYSFYKYNGSGFYERTSGGNDNMLELMSGIKWRIGIFNLQLGVGISHQFYDEVRYSEETQYHKATTIIDAKNKTIIAGLFGLGFDIHIYDKFSMLAEGDLFFREYLGSAWLLGVKYSINKL